MHFSESLLRASTALLTLYSLRVPVTFLKKCPSCKLRFLHYLQKASIFYNSRAMGNSRAIYGHHYLCINGPWPKYLQLLLWCSKTLIHDSTTLSTEMLCVARMKMSITASHPLLLVNFTFHLFIKLTFHLFIKVPGKNVSFNSTLFLALFIFS